MQTHSLVYSESSEYFTQNAKELIHNEQIFADIALEKS